jgi:Surface antigen
MIPFFLAVDMPSLPNNPANTSQPKPVLIAQAAGANSSSAASKSFPYASLRLGVGFPQDYKGSFDVDDISADTTLNLNTGFNGELAIGYQFNQARAELAVGYGNYGVDRQSFDLGSFGSVSTDGNGSANVTTVMVNGYYDIPIYGHKGVKSRWSPYIGAGIGYANIGLPSCNGDGCFSGGSVNGLAYQGKVGVSYRASEQGFAFLEGGYLGATGSSVDGIAFDNFGTWQVSIGWRQGFGGATRKSVAQAAPASQPEPVMSPQPKPASQPEPPIRGLW